MTPAWDSPWLLAAALLLGAVVVVYAVARLRRRRRAEGRGGGRRRKRRSAGSGPAPRRPIRSDEEWEEQFRRSLAEASGGEDRDTSPRAGSPDDAPSEAAGLPPGADPGRNGHDASASLSGEAPALELLPGRLHPLRGYRGHDLRFVSQPDGNRFTLGSEKGEGRHHVQIRAPTVGGVHAAMEYADGRWYVANRSEADPVHVNGAPLDDGAPHPLSGGDRIEMGEVSFLFLER